MNTHARHLEHSGANADQLTIGMLSQLIEMHGQRYGCTDTQTLAMFGDGQFVHADLAETMKLMESAGYHVSKPYRHYPTAKPLHAQWVVDVALPGDGGKASLSFLIPFDVA